MSWHPVSNRSSLAVVYDARAEVVVGCGRCVLQQQISPALCQVSDLAGRLRVIRSNVKKRLCLKTVEGDLVLSKNGQFGTFKETWWCVINNS